MALKTGSLMFSVSGLFASNFGISSFFLISEKKSFKSSAVSDSKVGVFFQSDLFSFLILSCQRVKVLLFPKISYRP